MSDLKTIEKKQLEDLFEMGSGYVLDFSNQTFHDFIFEAARRDIYSMQYNTFGDSKAKRLRAFWKSEPNEVVGRVLIELIDYWRFLNRGADCDRVTLADSCQKIAERLLGRTADEAAIKVAFIDRDFGEANIEAITIDAGLLPVLKARLNEVFITHKSGAPLATIFLCGSILEGLLLGIASRRQREFNQAPNSPKNKDGKVKLIHQWTLAQLIDVSCELRILTLDVKKFSHALRDFRNFIHPNQQLVSKFNPDQHTATICVQVLKAAIACLNGNRGES